jgi:hypothetical protein
MPRSLLSFALAVSLLGCAQRPLRANSALALYSWKPDGQPWHFALIPDPHPKHVSRSEVLKTTTPLIGVAALKSRLASTPHTSWAIVWRDDPPAYTLRYPSRKVCDEIIAFGKAHSLNIERLPTLYE